MALSIDSTTNLNLIDAAESTTGWTFSSITKTATSSASREGSLCVGGQIGVNTAGYAWHTHGSSVNMTTAGNERVYIWVNSVGVGTVAQGGWMVVIGDGTNRRAYTVGGSDDVPFSVKGWYCLMLDTANLPTTYNQIAGGAPNLNAITQFGAGLYNTVAPSGNALNVFFDVVRYGSGIIATSGATDDISLADIADDDFSSASGKAYGIIREIQPGVYGIQGDVLFGNTSGGSIDWKESDAVVIFEDRVRGSGTNTKFQMSGQHSSTGTFRTELGVAVSSGDSESGRSGVTFVSANPANQPVDFDFSDTDIEDVLLYGCTFTNLRGGNIAFSSDATNAVSHHISGCTFSGCSQVDLGRTVVRNSLFAATGDVDSAMLWNSNINIKNSNFIGNTVGAAIEHSAQGTFTYDNLKFTGNTDDVLYSAAASSGVLTIQNTNGADASTDEITNPTGNSVSFITSVPVRVTAKDASGNPISGARVLIEASPLATGTHTGSSGATTLTDSNQSWDADELIGYRIYNVTDKSSGTITDNDATTVTATLAGGTDNDWDADDEYVINKLPSDETVDITQSAGTATVDHPNHGLATGDQVIIRGANQDEYLKLATITVTNSNTYTYTVDSGATSPATGTITSTALIMTGTTNASGVYQITDFNYINDQPIRGVVRKAS